MWFKIAKNKKKSRAILEIAAKMHSPFCPNLADFSACVPPALQNGSRFIFIFGNFDLLKHSHNKFWSQNLLNFFFLWATLANLRAIALFFIFKAMCNIVVFCYVGFYWVYNMHIWQCIYQSVILVYTVWHSDRHHVLAVCILSTAHTSLEVSVV